jgi:hypothetical protein
MSRGLKRVVVGLIAGGLLLNLIAAFVARNVFHTPIEEQVAGHGLVDHLGGLLGSLVLGGFGLLLIAVGIGVAIGAAVRSSRSNGPQQGAPSGYEANDPSR